MINIEILKAAVMDSRDGIAISDYTQPDNPLIFVNPAFEAMTGYLSEEVLNKNCRFLQGNNRDMPQLDIIRTSIKQGRACLVTLPNYRKDGTLFWNELSLSPIHGDNGKITHFLSIQKDITTKILLEETIREQNQELQKSKTLLEFMLNFDALTGVRSRRFLEEQLNIQWKIAVRYKQKISIYMIDIDYFKQFNDIYGHAGGDTALKAVGLALSTSFMRSADFVARYGGEEFTILIVGMEEDQAEDFANTIVQTIADLKIPHAAAPTKFLTISLGYIYCEPTSNDDAMTAISRADKALYNAKASGRNQAIKYER